MKKLSLILLCLLLASCNFEAVGISTTRLKAVYLVYGQGELASKDLQAHPEVVVVQSFDEFKKYTQHKIALWIDKSVTPFSSEQEKWINEAPQVYYPIVLVGYSDTLYSFRDLLKLCCFMGPIIGWEIQPGFSVMQWKATNASDDHVVITLQGYNKKPTVQSILEITNTLLVGRLKPSPTTP